MFLPVIFLGGLITGSLGEILRSDTRRTEDCITRGLLTVEETLCGSGDCSVPSDPCPDIDEVQPDAGQSTFAATKVEHIRMPLGGGIDKEGHLIFPDNSWVFTVVWERELVQEQKRDTRDSPARGNGMRASMTVNELLVAAGSDPIDELPAVSKHVIYIRSKRLEHPVERAPCEPSFLLSKKHAEER